MPHLRTARSRALQGVAAAFGAAPLLAAPAGVDDCRALVTYAGSGRDLVAALKFRNRRSVVPWLAERLAVEVADCHADVVTWAPTSPVRRRRRGFDQSELLAHRTARAAGLPLANCLARLPGPAQTGRTLADRQIGPRFDAAPWHREHRCAGARSRWSTTSSRRGRP